ncbi:hypothetical protein [Nocardia paucivorans]|nr:hypothetical protein [Nocardia paucivorans]
MMRRQRNAAVEWALLIRVTGVAMAGHRPVPETPAQKEVSGQ